MGKERFVWLSGYSPSLRKARAETEADALGMLLAGFLRLVCLEEALPTVGWSYLHSFSTKKIPLQTCPQVSLMESNTSSDISSSQEHQVGNKVWPPHL